MSAPIEPAPSLNNRHRPRRRGGIGIAVLTLLGLLAIAAFVLAVPHRAGPGTGQPAPAFEPDRLQGLQDRVDQLQQRLDALEHRPPAPTPAPVPAASDGVAVALGARLDGQSAALNSVDARLHADEARLDAAQGQAAAIGAVNDRTARLARLFSFQSQLQAGLPLGAMPPGAPPGLARFATVAPITEARLRLTFPQAAAAARQAAGSGLPFWPALRARLGRLITLRAGGRVLLGNPDLARIAQAQAALEAGDLAACVSLVATLNGSAAQAFAGWRASAEALLQARADLAALARQG